MVLLRVEEWFLCFWLDTKCRREISNARKDEIAQKSCRFIISIKVVWLKTGKFAFQMAKRLNEDKISESFHKLLYWDEEGHKKKEII